MRYDCYSYDNDDEFNETNDHNEYEKNGDSEESNKNEESEIIQGRSKHLNWNKNQRVGLK